MKFFSLRRSFALAYQLGKIATHAAIEVRRPQGRFMKADPSIKTGTLYQDHGRPRGVQLRRCPRACRTTTMPLRSKDLAEVISDCYEHLGRRRRSTSWTR